MISLNRGEATGTNTRFYKDKDDNPIQWPMSIPPPPPPSQTNDLSTPFRQGEWSDNFCQSWPKAAQETSKFKFSTPLAHRFEPPGLHWMRHLRLPLGSVRGSVTTTWCRWTEIVAVQNSAFWQALCGKFFGTICAYTSPKMVWVICTQPMIYSLQVHP